MVGVLNTPPPNPEDYDEGTAVYVNEPGFYTIVLGSKKPECKAFKRWVAYEVQHGAQTKSPPPHNINTVRNCSNCPLQSLPLARCCALLQQPSQQPSRSLGCALSVPSVPAPTRGAAVAKHVGTEVTQNPGHFACTSGAQSDGRAFVRRCGVDGASARPDTLNHRSGTAWYHGSLTAGAVRDSQTQGLYHQYKLDSSRSAQAAF